MSSPSLVSKNLSIGYGKKVIRQNIDLELFPGEVIGVMGKNGSGKSTLLKTLSGIHPQIEGTVEVMGSQLSELSRREMAKKVSVVLTNNQSFSNLSVEEIFRLGRYPYTNFWGDLKEDDQYIIHESMEIVGALPMKSSKFNELSDGQKQKVLIGRALAQDTPVLILDEPTSFLDIPSKMEIVKLLKIIAGEKGKAVLFSSHDWELVLTMLPLCLLLSEKEMMMASPEDLIIEGKVEESFVSEQFLFDPIDARFKEKNFSDKSVFLEVEDPQTREWVAHFFKKLSYKVVNNKLEASKRIVMRNGVWSVDGKNFHPTLGHILREL